MSSNVNNCINRWLWEKRIPYPINVTLTEKQSFRGQKIDDVVSESNFRHFKNVLNQKTFGNGYRRFGKQLRMLVVREVSPLLRHHLHCIIENPSSPNREDWWLRSIILFFLVTQTRLRSLNNYPIDNNC